LIPNWYISPSNEGKGVIYEELRKMLTEAIRENKPEGHKTLLRTVMGECQRGVMTAWHPIDEYCSQVIKKMVTNNRETITKLHQAGRQDDVRKYIDENEFLLSLLPNLLSESRVCLELEPIRDQILAAKADGQAIGLANKHLKGKGYDFFGEDVKNAVTLVRRAM
jgi:uncharacterized protein YqeY